MTSPSRQFWIVFDDTEDYFLDFEPVDKINREVVHVIEMSAFLALQQQADKLAEALEVYANEMETVYKDCDNHSSYHTYHVDMNEFICKKCGNAEDSAPGRVSFEQRTRKALAAFEALAAYKAYKGES